MSELQPVPFRKPRGHEPRLSQPYVPGKRAARFWTDAERAVVREHYPVGGYAACQPHLPAHRSRLSVYQEAQKLGLTAPVKRGGGKKFQVVPPADFEEQIRAFYQNADGRKKGECNEFADRIGLPRWWVTKQAIRLGLALPHKKEPPWTAAENELMKSVPLHDPHRCAEIFRQHGFARSPTAIMVRAKRRNISRRYRETLSATAASKILGVDGKTVTREILQGDLHATKRKTNRLSQQGGDPWSIARADLRRYILDHLERIDLRKVEKFEFVSIVAGDQLTPEGQAQ